MCVRPRVLRGCLFIICFSVICIVHTGQGCLLVSLVYVYVQSLWVLGFDFIITYRDVICLFISNDMG